MNTIKQGNTKVGEINDFTMFTDEDANDYGYCEYEEGEITISKGNSLILSGVEYEMDLILDTGNPHGHYDLRGNNVLSIGLYPKEDSEDIAIEDMWWEIELPTDSTRWVKLVKWEAIVSKADLENLGFVRVG